MRSNLSYRASQTGIEDDLRILSQIPDLPTCESTNKLLDALESKEDAEAVLGLAQLLSNESLNGLKSGGKSAMRGLLVMDLLEVAKSYSLNPRQPQALATTFPPSKFA